MKKYFPGAIEAIKRAFRNALRINYKEYVNKYKTEDVDDLVENIIQYYVIKKPQHSIVPGEFSISYFATPTDSVYFEWNGECWYGVAK